jgi:hypothetical protein
VRACQGENCSDNGEAVLVVVVVVVIQEENDDDEEGEGEGEEQGKDEMLINGPDYLALYSFLLFPSSFSAFTSSILY